MPQGILKKDATRREKPKASRVCREAEGFEPREKPKASRVRRREAEGFERGEVEVSVFQNLIIF